MGVFNSMFRGRGQSRPDGKMKPVTQVEAVAAKTRGNECLAGGDLDRAVACYREAIRLHPGYAEAYNNLGHVLGRQAEYAEAEVMLRQALTLDKDLGPAHFNLGVVSQAQGNFDQAINCFGRAIRLMPDHMESHWRLGNLLSNQGDNEAAVGAYQQAIRIETDMAELHINLGTAFKKLGRFEEARHHYEHALAIAEHPVAADFLGILFQEQQQWTKASACYQRACSIKPDYFQVRWNLALLSLLCGDYRAGFEHFEQRLYLTSGRPTWAAAAQLLMSAFGVDRHWRRGEDLAEKTLLVWTEQGLGDSLMMMRYLPWLKAAGAGRLILYCEPGLVRIAERIPGVDAVIQKPAEIPADAFHRHCAIMSLPYLFETGLDSIPDRIPYLAAPDDKQQAWAFRLAALPGLKVGLVWGGSSQLSRDALRSIPLEKFAPLMRVPGIIWLSLQKGPPAAQLAAVGWPIASWIDNCDDMLDTAALVSSLDLVISADTAVAHLAGALGRPVWLLNRYESEWRWMIERNDSPWYPSLRIFRQPCPYDWDSVIAQLSAELAALIGDP